MDMKNKRMPVYIFAAVLVFLCSVLCSAMADGAFPETGNSAFLQEGEFVYENPEEGVWRYLSPTLRIEIFRHEDTKLKRVWFVADIQAQSDERFHLIPKDPAKRMTRMDYVHNIAKENGIVFATSSDFAHLRIQQKIRAGILIRDGQIISSKTRTPKSTVFPNLDTLALFEDGDMRAFVFNEYEAEEYLKMGAVDVMAFGPILIKDSIINEEVLSKYGTYREPRIGIGFIDKGHYIAIMVEGRHAESRGVSTCDLAELFQKEGCTMAFNLDGGQSASMVFMGTQIVHVGSNQQKTKATKSIPARSTAEIFGIGHTALMENPQP